jgi:hypothetical protein
MYEGGGSSKEVLEPSGLAFVTNKKFVLPGKGELPIMRGGVIGVAGGWLRLALDVDH